MNNGVTNNQSTNNGISATTNSQQIPVNGQVSYNAGVTTQTVGIPNQAVTTTSAVSTNQQNMINPAPSGNSNNGDVESQPKKSKGKMNIVPVLIVIILALGGYTIYSLKAHNEQIKNIMYNCTPITASSEDMKLDLNSTLVKDLYSKVATSIREDLAQPEFNDNMRLYLAYRQILENDKYDSNCNLFNGLAMEPYTCEITPNFTPKAFKEETLVQEIKKMYGENTSIPLSNIKLGSACIGGYQYIPARGEFVQGQCNQQTATSYRATKTLKEAISKRNTIILVEEVKYHENEKMALPEYLKSGLYYYTFRLDMNYNYVLVSKEYKSKY